MNWTGGALGRSRNANTSVSVIQKKHFAKARGKRQVGRTSPPNFELFGNISVRPAPDILDGRPQSKIRSGSHGRVDANPQGYQNCLESSYGRNPKRSRISQPSKPEPDARPSRLAHEINTYSPIIISSRPSSSAAAFGDDVSPVPSIEQPQPLESISIQAQRTRLLCLRDWVGISHTKPAKINFPDRSDRDQIGKRRRRSEMKHLTGLSKRRIYRPHAPSFQLHQFAARDYLSQAYISVRIDSAVDRRSLQDERERRSVSKPDHVSPMSDEMLLDERYSDAMVDSSSSRNYYHIRGVETPPRRKIRHHSLTPSAFMDESDLAHFGKHVASSTEDIEKPQPCGEPPIHSKQIPTSLQPAEGPVLVVRRRNEEPASFRFEFSQTPCQRGLRSGTRTNNPATQNLTLELPETGVPRRQRSSLWKNEREDRMRHSLTDSGPEKGRTVFGTSSLSWESRRYPSKPQNQILRPADRDGQPIELRSKANGENCDIDLGTDAIEAGVLEFKSQQVKESEPQSPRAPLEPAEEDWLRLLNVEPPEQPIQPAALAVGWATALLKKSDEPTTVAPTPQVKDVNSPAVQAQKHTDEKKEEEALWRKFCFGGEKADHDWIIDPEETAVAQSAPSAGLPIQLQSSMEAEVATSTVKQNPHLRTEDMSSSPITQTNGTSMAVGASGTSTINVQNSDEMLDVSSNSSLSFHGFLPMEHSSPATSGPVLIEYHPQNSAQASTPPPPTITIGPHAGNAVANTPSSLNVQVSSTEPNQPSSDPLSWSPARLSQAQTLSTAKPAVIFKKPTRYVGERSSDPVETLRLGGRVAKKARKGRGKKQVGVGSDDGCLWEIGAEREGEGVEDDIEDD